MKTKFTILALLTTVAFYGQLDDYKKIPKGSCKVDHTCRAEFRKDSFENTTTYKIGFYETALSKRGLTYVIFRDILEDKREQTQIIFFAEKEGCNTKSSYVHIQFKNGEKLKLPRTKGSIECGSRSIIVNVSDYLDLLMTEPIEKIRVYIDQDDDFEVTEKGQKKFFENIKCIGKLSV